MAGLNNRRQNSSVKSRVYKGLVKFLNGQKLTRIRLSFTRDPRNRASFFLGSVQTACIGKKFVRSKIAWTRVSRP